MRNARQKKQRFYRKAARTHKQGINLWRLFNKLHPEHDWRTSLRRPWTQEDWHASYRAQEEWLNGVTGQACSSYVHGCGNPPKHFRQQLNQDRRAREKAALRKVEISGDWDDFFLPKYRHSANREWW